MEEGGTAAEMDFAMEVLRCVVFDSESRQEAGVQASDDWASWGTALLSRKIRVRAPVGGHRPLQP